MPNEFDVAPKKAFPVAQKRKFQPEVDRPDMLSAARLQRSQAGGTRALDNLAASNQFAGLRPSPRAPVMQAAQRSTHGGPSPSNTTQRFDNRIHKTPPQNAVRVGSHYSHAGHDASFVQNGIIPRYGDNFGGELEHGEGFYITTDADGARWGADPQNGAHDLRQWDVFVDSETLPKLTGLKASDMPNDHKWQPLPYAENPELSSYIDDYDYIVDEYQHQATRQTVRDIKFNPRALNHLYLVPNGFYDELPPASQPAAASSHAQHGYPQGHAGSEDASERYAQAWSEYEINKRRRV